MRSEKGRVHSIQSLGTVDGPGVRFVVFLQGCNLRCGCCHNPDTWSMDGGTVYTAEEILAKVLRCRSYFGKDGGITVSGGEPLLQPSFVRSLFTICHEEDIHTCLDTSGSLLNAEVEALTEVTDRVLLDIKYTTETDYKTYVGCGMEKPLAFLRLLNEKKIPTTLRQVIIPTLNDNEENIHRLYALKEANPCVDKVELLPFRKICRIKYDNMGIPFPFDHLPEPDGATMARLQSLL